MVIVERGGPGPSQRLSTRPACHGLDGVVTPDTRSTGRGRRGDAGGVTTVVCRRCGNPLTGALTPGTADDLTRDAQDREPTVAAGLLVRDPAPVTVWVSVGRAPATEREDAPAGCLVVHPDTTRGLRPARPDNGCCGSDGCDGPNRACTGCGARIGIARTDCWTALEMRFFPDAVDLR